MESSIAKGEALLAAASRGRLEEVRALLLAGANVNFRDVFHGGTSLHKVAKIGDCLIAEELLKHGADPNICTSNTSSSPLGSAALAGHQNMVKLLIDNGGRLSIEDYESGLIDECRRDGLEEIADLLIAASL